MRRLTFVLSADASIVSRIMRSDGVSERRWALKEVMQALVHANIDRTTNDSNVDHANSVQRHLEALPAPNQFERKVGKFNLSRQDSIKLICKVTDQDDPFWEQLVDEWYDEETDTMPSIYDVLGILGIAAHEIDAATGKVACD